MNLLRLHCLKILLSDNNHQLSPHNKMGIDTTIIQFQLLWIIGFLLYSIISFEI